MGDTNPNDYFSSYEDLEVHRLMLEDFQRTDAYKRAILNNKEYFNGKTVMDVGCGTGILSIFCAQAGARKVYAVEASNVAKLAEEIIKENGFEKVIEVIHSKVEDVTLPCGTKVDAIVSEWMGFYLLHEGMLDSVMYARDKYLKDGGQMFPESATVYVAPCSVPSLYDNWLNVHGVSMKAISKELRQCKTIKPEILKVDKDDIIGEEIALCWINIKEDSVDSLNQFTMEHVLGASKHSKYQGICVWFDCLFPDLSDKSDGAVILSTSPSAEPTHWNQTVLVFPDERVVEQGEPIAFDISISRSAGNKRWYNLQVSLLDPDKVEHPTPCSCDMTKCIVVKKFMEQHPEQNDDNVLDDVSIHSEE